MIEPLPGLPELGALLFAGLATASFFTAFIGVVTGAAGGLILLGILAMVFPPMVLIPMHTVVQLGIAGSRTVLLWPHVMHGALLPFLAGSLVGAASGARLFVSLPTSALQGIIGLFILLVTWMPKLGRIGGERRRFTVLGFGATFLGMFVSATGTIIAPFVAAAAADRRAHAATLGALMGIVHISKLAAFGFIGVAVGAYLPLMAAMIATGTLGNWVGGKALQRVTEVRFRQVFRWLLTALGLRLVWMAVGSAGWL